MFLARTLVSVAVSASRLCLISATAAQGGVSLRNQDRVA